jgi:uncharacterized membrane protein YoaK (UPF0700 family)
MFDSQIPKPRRLGFMRQVVAHERTHAADVALGGVLAFVAGAINAGGYLAVGQYTSHMSGIVSAIADHVVLGAFGLFAAGLGALLAFIAGAACSAILINWGRRHHEKSQYALPLLLEALLLLGFGSLGAAMGGATFFVFLAVPLLCFIMGLQNATITKLSGARIRTTHVTGMVTDIGIELGKFTYWNRNASLPKELAVVADLAKLRLLGLLLGMFLIGGVIGALGFGRLGYVFSAPLACLLLLISVPQIAKSFG